LAEKKTPRDIPPLIEPQQQPEPEVERATPTGRVRRVSTPPIRDTTEPRKQEAPPMPERIIGPEPGKQVDTREIVRDIMEMMDERDKRRERTVGRTPRAEPRTQRQPAPAPTPWLRGVELLCIGALIWLLGLMFTFWLLPAGMAINEAAALPAFVAGGCALAPVVGMWMVFQALFPKTGRRWR